MNCTVCGQAVPPSARNCPSCQADAGFPNVRAADTNEETVALQQRFRDAEISTKARGCESALKDFGRAVQLSKAVFCRNLGQVNSLISSDSELYTSYYNQLEGQSRLPEDNRFDRGRSAVDGTLFPNYHKHICFAALSLNELGVSRYGKYTIVLREKMILQRATVFEENSFAFCQIKHRIVVGEPVPVGYRATWAKRSILAMAKLHSKIEPTTREDEYAGILLHNGASDSEDEFIEVHIWGPIHRRAIEKVVGPKPKRGSELVLWKSVGRKLSEVGAVLEIQ